MDPTDRPIRKRRRPMSSCEQCRRRKVKCDQKSPCDQCIRSKCNSCIYYRFPPSSNRDSTPPVEDERYIPKVNEFFQQNGLTREILSSEHAFNSPPASDKAVVEPINLGTTPGKTAGTDSRSIRELQAKIDHLEKELNIAKQADEVPHRQFYADSTALKGVVSKTRLMGRSHFMYIIKQGFVSIVDLYESMATKNSDNGMLADVEKCKRLGKAIKEKHQWHQPLSSDLKSYVPAKEVCDTLIGAYFRTFETVYRILHIPSFYDEYNNFWATPDKASSPFLVKFLLVLAIGAAFQHGQQSSDELRQSAKKWIHVAHSWLTFPFTEKHIISLTGVQIYCLLLVAREIMEVGSDMIWLAAGTLVRTANLIGLHRDPSKFPGMTEYQIEMRRRLWATVTEICSQSSLAAGGLPLIDLDDSDCQPPRNLDDDQFGEGLKGVPIERPANTMTQTTMQILFAQSLPVRLKISRALNNTIVDLSYTDTNRLGLELSQIYQGQLKQLSHFKETQRKPSAFQLRMLKLTHVGTLGILHMPYALQARKNPSYYFSRKTCLDVALSVLAPDDEILAGLSTSPESIRDSRCLEIIGGGYFRGLSTISALMLYGEISNQNDSVSMFMSAAENAVRKEMRRAFEHFNDLTLERLKAGERNIKGHLFSGAIQAQLDAKENGVPPGEAIAKALRASLDKCIAILEAKAGTVQTPGSEAVVSDQFSLDNFPVDMIPEPFWWDDMDFDYQGMNFNRTWNTL